MLKVAKRMEITKQLQYELNVCNKSSVAHYFIGFKDLRIALFKHTNLLPTVIG